MKKFRYQLDQRIPIVEVVVYGIQWAVMLFPGLLIITDIAAGVLNLNIVGKAHFFQYLLVISGTFTVLQTLWGHRYPIQEGPSTAVLLAYIGIVPYGIRAIQGGLIAGGLSILLIGLSRQTRKLNQYFTPNVTGVILLLIAFCLLPFLLPRLLGVSSQNPSGSYFIAAVSFALIIFIALLSHWLSGYLQTTAVLLGVIAGYIAFSVLGKIDFKVIIETPWIELPSHEWSSTPQLFWPAIISFVFAYLAVVINTIGSIQGTAAVVGEREIEKSIDRGIALNGLGGIVAGLFGVVGTVSYSSSPGVVLATRIASRYALTACCMFLIVTGLIPKLAAMFASVPGSVVGAALCVAIGFQIGAGIDVITSHVKKLSARDYLVIGLPLIVGTIVSMVPREFFAGLPTALAVIVSNGLVLGIIMVLVLEHGLLRKK
ncbi:MAG: hypothetical protein DRG59_10410 [Deltaproteobacteria bacterium]|nr:MAG: hypothetical protein DRG59_10410 [Deltaproteobacteria bacterium]